MPRQPLTRVAARIARAAALATLTFVAPAAFAQYSISAAGTPSGPGTCNGANVLVPMTGGSLTLTLPPPPNNVYVTSSVNGGPVLTVATTNATGVVPEPSFAFEVSPPTLPPYTLTQAFFPAMAGVPTGTGVIFTVICDGVGVASVSWVNGALPPGTGGGGTVSSSLAVPTLSWPALLALIAMIVAVSFRRARERRGAFESPRLRC
jgi:hypothetical protein